MDIFVHAAVGAASGALFGHPIVGAVAGVIPDFVLGLQRRKEPTRCYRITHSVIVALAACGAALLCGIHYTLAGAFVAAWLSHIAIDIPTHGAQWAPRILYPFSDTYFKGFEEWEFFSPGWIVGSFISFGWIALCLYFLK